MNKYALKLATKVYNLKACSGQSTVVQVAQLYNWYSYGTDDFQTIKI